MFLLFILDRRVNIESLRRSPSNINYELHLNHLQLVPFLVAVFRHELRRRAAELLRFVRHFLSVVLQSIQFVTALHHQHVSSADFISSRTSTRAQLLDIGVRTGHQLRYRAIRFAARRLTNCSCTITEFQLNSNKGEEIAKTYTALLDLCSLFRRRKAL